MTALAAVLAAAAAVAGPSAKPPTATIDHIILGASDLDAAMQDFAQRSGVRPQFGGVHPGGGTRNGIVSLGSGRYLEIIAPDPAQDTSKGFAAELAALKRPTVVGWAVGTNDSARLAATLKRLGRAARDPSPGARTRPDGVALSWVTFDLIGVDDKVAPFFIEWRSSDHPSRTAPAGCRLHDFLIEASDPGPLRKLVAALRLPVRVKRAGQARLVLAADCPKGRIRF